MILPSSPVPSLYRFSVDHPPPTNLLSWLSPSGPLASFREHCYATLPDGNIQPYSSATFPQLQATGTASSLLHGDSDRGPALPRQRGVLHDPSTVQPHALQCCHGCTSCVRLQHQRYDAPATRLPPALPIQPPTIPHSCRALLSLGSVSNSIAARTARPRPPASPGASSLVQLCSTSVASQALVWAARHQLLHFSPCC